MRVFDPIQMTMFCPREKILNNYMYSPKKSNAKRALEGPPLGFIIDIIHIKSIKNFVIPSPLCN